MQDQNFFPPPGPEKRQIQATECLVGFAGTELSSLELFTVQACPSTPMLLDHKQGIKDRGGLLPGGYFPLTDIQVTWPSHWT
jgi:hypothetical protein